MASLYLWTSILHHQLVPNVSSDLIQQQKYEECRNCVPIEHSGITLPDVIVSKKGKQQLRRERLQKKATILLEHAEPRAAGQINVNVPGQYAENQAPSPRLVSEIQVFFKLNDDDEREYANQRLFGPNAYSIKVCTLAQP